MMAQNIVPLMVKNVYNEQQFSPILQEHIETLARKIAEEEIEKFKKELKHNTNSGIIE